MKAGLGRGCGKAASIVLELVRKVEDLELACLGLCSGEAGDDTDCPILNVLTRVLIRDLGTSRWT